MNIAITYEKNKATTNEIAHHLRLCNNKFTPPLTSKVNINDYAEKIVANAYTFEARSNGELIGLVAAYFNSSINRHAFITNVSVLSERNRARDCNRTDFSMH